MSPNQGKVFIKNLIDMLDKVPYDLAKKNITRPFID